MKLKLLVSMVLVYANSAHADASDYMRLDSFRFGKKDQNGKITATISGRYFGYCTFKDKVIVQDKITRIDCTDPEIARVGLRAYKQVKLSVIEKNTDLMADAYQGKFTDKPYDPDAPMVVTYKISLIDPVNDIEK